MTDRELLELAAKAAGIKHRFTANGLHSWDESDDANHKFWNPLTDDGDALRLAVALRTTIYLDTSMVEVEAVEDPCTESFLDDPLAATRRAIVRAAAEIGRATP